MSKVVWISKEVAQETIARHIRWVRIQQLRRIIVLGLVYTAILISLQASLIMFLTYFGIAVVFVLLLILIKK